MKKCLVFIIFIFLCCLTVTAQINDNRIRISILKKGITDHTYVFGRWTKAGATETHLNYLGQFKTMTGKSYKIITSIWYWGLSHRATSRILIFTGDNNYVGNYSLGSVYDIPVKLKGSHLVFNNKDNPDCDKSIFTTVDLSNGIPKQIFIKCQGECGDIYSFSAE